jgi:hypothetical protein
MKAQIRAKTRNRGRGWAEYRRPDVKKRRPGVESGRRLEMLLRMKTERKRTELSGATFIFIFLYESRNEYINIKKNENGYFRKQKWNEYGTNTDKKWMIIGTKRPPESCSKTQAS